MVRMEATTKVISRSKAWVPGKPELPQRVQIVIRCGKLSVTKHLRYDHESAMYVGFAYDHHRRMRVQIAFPIRIVSQELKANVRLKVAA